MKRGRTSRHAFVARGPVGGGLALLAPRSPGTSTCGRSSVAVVTLGDHHQTVTSLQDTAQALRPLVGSLAADLFAIGLITSAVVALPVLMATTADVVSPASRTVPPTLDGVRPRPRLEWSAGSSSCGGATSSDRSDWHRGLACPLLRSTQSSASRSESVLRSRPQGRPGDPAHRDHSPKCQPEAMKSASLLERITAATNSTISSNSFPPPKRRGSLSSLESVFMFFAEQRLGGPAIEHSGELPAQIDRFSDAGVEAVADSGAPYHRRGRRASRRTCRRSASGRATRQLRGPQSRPSHRAGSGRSLRVFGGLANVSCCDGANPGPQPASNRTRGTVVARCQRDHVRAVDDRLASPRAAMSKRCSTRRSRRPVDLDAALGAIQTRGSGRDVASALIGHRNGAVRGC